MGVVVREGVRGRSEVHLPSSWQMCARPGDPRDRSEGLPCPHTIIRAAPTWGFAPFRPATYATLKSHHALPTTCKQANTRIFFVDSAAPRLQKAAQ